MLSSNELMKSVGLNKNGKVQQFIDAFVLYHCEPYLPSRIHLQKAGISATKLGSGKVIWNNPDANYLYEGKLMVDEFTHSSWARKGTQKIMDPKGRNLIFHGGGLRGDHWFDRMIRVEMNDLNKGVQSMVNGGKH